MQLVGPLPRGIFSAAAFDGRTAAGDGAVRATDAPVAEDDCAREGAKLWGAGNPFRRAVRIERECGAHGAEAVRYTNVCCLFDLRMGTRLFEWFWAPASASRGYGVPLAFLKSSRSRVPRTHTHTRWGRRAFCGCGRKKREGLAGLRPPTGRQAKRCVLRAGLASRPGEGLGDVGAAGAFRLRGWTDATCGELRGSGGRRRSALGRLLFLSFFGFPAGEEFVWLRFAAADAQHNTTASAARQRPSE
ncbi:retrotransposon hot spot (RHS) protein [Trypanosoma conorhini]|uniref:Retrotransposon hot spot (RHS) protein n=1 Tax=Trypanosoma conorhini TaxID=83891 RepID=A0A3R7M1A3_9TRYP|nr:retrotransposon hot spot (RHS) protein [Trypanosoma conorhini]RNE97508.1 retrotransposon hot spot (RHS) protein [Trypanosoma conorhini]